MADGSAISASSSDDLASRAPYLPGARRPQAPVVTGPLTKRDTESNPLPTAPATTGNWLTQALRARLLRVRWILADAAQITPIGPERRAEGPRCRSSASDRLVTGRHQIERIHADPCGFSGGGVAVQKHWPERGKPLFCGLFCRRGTQESNLTLRFWRPPCYRYTSPPRSCSV